jgi:hypothetical protein
MRQRPPMGRTGLSSGRDAERSSPSGPHRRPALQRDAMRPDARGPPRGQHRPAWPLTPTLTCPLPKRRWIRVRVAHRRARCGPWFEVIRSWRLRDGTLSTHPPPSTLGLLPLVFLGGVAALCWEVLWQLEASLAMGVSAKGTALTLVATMGGMSLGAALAGRALRTRRIRRPLRLYGTLELVVGLSGVVLLLPSFRALERVSDALYASHPGLTGAVHFVGIVLLLGPPTLAMGASIPVFGLMTRGSALSVASLYAANTAGAALGVLLLSFLFLPHLGVELAAIAIACLNLSVAAVCWVSRSEAPPVGRGGRPHRIGGRKGRVARGRRRLRVGLRLAGPRGGLVSRPAGRFPQHHAGVRDHARLRVASPRRGSGSGEPPRATADPARGPSGRGRRRHPARHARGRALRPAGGPSGARLLVDDRAVAWRRARGDRPSDGASRCMPAPGC